MIAWLAPWALVGAALLAGPLLVHMLLRRHARRAVFPAIHFVPPIRVAAVRFRRPSDIALLVLRLAIVAAAVLAAAQPVLVTPSRVAGWNARTIRALIVDTSRGLASADETIRVEEQGAFHSRRFASSNLRESLAKAATWFSVAPPGRREAVIISDFQKGALDRADLQLLPTAAGVRLIRNGTTPGVRDVQLPDVTGFRGARWQPSLRLEPEATRVTWRSTGEGAPPWLTTMEAAGDREAAARAWRAAAAAGIAEGDASRAVSIRFAGAPPDRSSRRQPRTPWMVDATLALRRSTLAEETGAALNVFEADGRLVVETTGAASAPAAPAIVRAVILAVRPRSIADREAEIVAVPEAELAAWSREPAPGEAATAQPWSGRLSDSDARWMWLLALLLLGVEAWVRRARGGSVATEVRDAA